MRKKITLLLVDDHAIVRQGLATILGFQHDFVVIGEAKDGADAVRKADDLRPDVIIMDLIMPALSGAEAVALIHERHPDTRIVLLTSYGTAADLVQALEHGATGALLKTASKEELFACIRAVADGQTVISPDVQQALAETEEIPELTPRQMEILRSLSRGLTNNDIANQLGLRTAGVKSHLLTIFRKLGVANRSEAVSVAHQKHLLKD